MKLRCSKLIRHHPSAQRLQNFPFCEKKGNGYVPGSVASEFSGPFLRRQVTTDQYKVAIDPTVALTTKTIISTMCDTGWPCPSGLRNHRAPKNENTMKTISSFNLNANFFPMRQPGGHHVSLINFSAKLATRTRTYLSGRVAFCFRRVYVPYYYAFSL